MTITSLTTIADELGAHLACGVLGPDDVEYDQARRVWNADIDRLPAAIVRCTSAQDVSAALTWCVERGVAVTVRSGGHNLAGTSVADGAVLLDTALIDHVRIDTQARTITVGAGCRWGDVDRPASELDIAVPAGVVSHTGVAGLTARRWVRLPRAAVRRDGRLGRGDRGRRRGRARARARAPTSTRTCSGR